MVRKERLELSRHKTLVPKTSASTNSATLAWNYKDAKLYRIGLRNEVPSIRKDSGVDDGARTHDHRNHNPALYQLSYAHH